MKTKIIPVLALNQEQKKDMFNLMHFYYLDMSYEKFLDDLNEKNLIILAEDANFKILGFSTILIRSSALGNNRILTIFSGDTIMDKSLWGSGLLAYIFGVFLIKFKLKNLFTPVYWCLTTKGFKTYLLLANNFPEYYPRYDKPTPPEIKDFLDLFYRSKFGSLYSSENGWVSPSKNSGYLKQNVADISENQLKHPKIHFFQEKNPNWSQGYDLACVGKVTLWVPLRYFFKYIRKML